MSFPDKYNEYKSLNITGAGCNIIDGNFRYLSNIIPLLELDFTVSDTLVALAAIKKDKVISAA